MWLLIVLPIVGAVVMTAVRQLQDPQYQATAKVVLPQSELAATLAGIQPVYVDPDRHDEAEQNLAGSRALFVRAAAATNGRIGTASEMRGATEVDVSNNVVEFSTSGTDRLVAIATANAVARVYPAWRADAYGRTIDAAIRQIQAELAGGSDSPALEEQLQRLNVLKTLNSGDTAIVEPTDGAAQTSPRLVRDAVLGGVIGFVIALLVAGLRELLDTRVRTEADVEEAIGVPVLSTIQTIPKRARSKAVMADPRFADSYELLAANLAQILEDQERPTYVAVTSADPGEGKTTTSANLAVALARRGQDVVLADFDLRKPQLATMFSVPADAAGRLGRPARRRRRLVDALAHRAGGRGDDPWTGSRRRSLEWWPRQRTSRAAARGGRRVAAAASGRTLRNRRLGRDVLPPAEAPRLARAGGRVRHHRHAAGAADGGRRRAGADRQRRRRRSAAGNSHPTPPARAG